MFFRTNDMNLETKMIGFKDLNTATKWEETTAEKILECTKLHHLAQDCTWTLLAWLGAFGTCQRTFGAHFRCTNSKYMVMPRATEILKSKSVRSTDDVIGTCVRQSQIVTKTNDSSFSSKSVSEIDYFSYTHVVFELLNWSEAYMDGGKGKNMFVKVWH